MHKYQTTLIKRNDGMNDFERLQEQARACLDRAREHYCDADLFEHDKARRDAENDKALSLIRYACAARTRAGNMLIEEASKCTG